MKRFLIALGLLLAFAAVAEWANVRGLHISLWRYLPLLVSLSLVLAAFIGLTNPGVVAKLRAWAGRSARVAVGIPLLLLVPYAIYALGSSIFSAEAFLKLLAYIAAPNLLLLPDRQRSPLRAGWRDFTAMLALSLPVSAGWLAGIWTYPMELYFFRPLYSVCVGVYAFVVVRRLEGVGYRLFFRPKDFTDGLLHFLGFAAVGIPLGYALHFIRFRPSPVPIEAFMIEFVGTYLTVAIPEELLFRGIFQNFLEQSFSSERRSLYALLIASPIFGLSHMGHPPVPNWRYAIMATVAGLYYGNAYRRRRRVSSSALTHALVDTVWHSWF